MPYSMIRVLVIPTAILMGACGTARRSVAFNPLTTMSPRGDRGEAQVAAASPRRVWGCFHAGPNGPLICRTPERCEELITPHPGPHDPAGPCLHKTIAWCFPMFVGRGDGPKPDPEMDQPQDRLCTVSASTCESIRRGWSDISHIFSMPTPCAATEAE